MIQEQIQKCKKEGEIKALEELFFNQLKKLRLLLNDESLKNMLIYKILMRLFLDQKSFLKKQVFV